MKVKNTFSFGKQKSPAKIAKDVFIALICFAFTFLSFKILSPDVKTNADGGSSRYYYFTPEGGSNQYYVSFYAYDVNVDSYYYNTNTGIRGYYGSYNAYTSCSAGYAIGMNSAYDSSDLINKMDRTKTIPALSSEGPLQNNTWGMKKGSYYYSSISVNDVFTPLPNKNEQPYLLEDVYSNSSKYGNITYAAKTDSSVTAGIYYTDIMYTVYTRPQCAGYYAYFYYTDNSGYQSNTSRQIPYGSLVDLSSITIPERANYTLTGFKNRQTNDFYPIDAVPFDLNPNNSSSVYYEAVYEFNITPTTFSGITQMQQMTQAICDAETTPLPTATEITWQHSNDNNLVPRSILEDTRDHTKYIVSKLADGNCWMSQNLALDLDASTPLTSDDTDLRTKSTWTPEYSTQTSTGTTWTNSENKARSYHGTKAYVNGYSSTSSPRDGVEYAWEKSGNYYNFYAATAGSGTSSSTGNASDSICPKGWHLPTSIDANGKNTGSFYNLVDTYNATYTSIMSSPLNFTYAGIYVGNSGSTGYDVNGANYWTAGNYDNNRAVQFAFSRNDKRFYRNNESYHQRMHGFTIRCTTGSTYNLHIDTTGLDNVLTNNTDFNLTFGTETDLSTIIGAQQGGTYGGVSINDDYTIPSSSLSTKLKLYDPNKFDKNVIAKPIFYFGNLFSVTYMQDLTPRLCANTTTPFANASGFTTSYSTDRSLIPQRSLRDRRNNTLYIVRKMPNGECWMTQNLDYRTPQGVDGNGKYIYGYTNAYPAMAETATQIANTDLLDDNYYSRSDNARYQNKYYATQSIPYAQPFEHTSTTSEYPWGQTASDGAHSYLNYYYNTDVQEGQQPSVDILYMYRSPSVDSETGRYTFGFSLTSASNTQDMGVLYNWTAAAAGKMGVTSGNAESSICPKGWQLPNATGARSYQGVFQSVRNMTSSTSLSDFNWAANVLGFIPSGYYNWSTGGFTDRLSAGYFWTGTTDGAGKAYAAYMGISGSSVQVNSAVSIDKGMGASVRCVLRGE